MKKIISTFIFLSFFSVIFAQTTVKGRVLDEKKQPIVGANIVVKDTYDGGTADANGNFEFKTEETGNQILQATSIGFDSVSLKITLKGGIFEFNPVMKEGFNELKVVVISAGSFEASDEKKVTVLKPLDIVTTAAANGDTYGALKTLPGAQVSSGDADGLFVRGGSGSEAQTFIDGMLVRNPFFSSTPDYAARGRFNPFLFKGTVFSTGGYSAQFGQGMSSALNLETTDLPDRSAGTLAASVVGLGFGQQKLWKEKKMGAGISVNYTNLGPYFGLVAQKIDFSIKPEFTGTEGFFRKKTSETGIIKFYAYFNTGNVGFRTPVPDSVDAKANFSVKNYNFYSNLTYSELLNKNWKLNAGVSFSKDWNAINSSYNFGNLQAGQFDATNSLSQGRVVLTRYFGRLTTLRLGAEYQYSTDDFKIAAFNNPFEIKDNYTAAFAESDIYLTTKIVARLGARFENSSLLGKSNIAPRVSLAYKLGDADQLSFAYGEFYQKGDSLLRWQLLSAQVPDFQRATHLIFNYQYIKDDRTFRLEGYYKKYHDLVTTNYPRNARPSVTNDGTGYAQGFEIFYRDKKTLKSVDYWVSYSWLDTKRKYLDYPIEAQPTFAANHVATIVAKKFVAKLKTAFGMSYSYSTGRPYLNPNLPTSAFLTDRTPAFQNLSVNGSYLTSIGKAFAVIVLSVTNVTGDEQIFGYRYSADGKSRESLTPAAKRFFFVGCFLSWGTDRRKEVLDNQN